MREEAKKDCSRFWIPPHVLRASHHTSRRPFCFTPLVLRDSQHTSCNPALLTPPVLEADFASNHTSCKAACLTPQVLRASHHMSCKVSIERQSQFWISCHIVRCPAPRCTTRPSANTLLPSPAETTFLMTAPSFEALATPNFGYTLTIPLLVPCRHNLRATLASRLLTTPPSPGDTTFSW